MQTRVEYIITKCKTGGGRMEDRESEVSEGKKGRKGEDLDGNENGNGKESCG